MNQKNNYRKLEVKEREQIKWQGFLFFFSFLFRWGMSLFKLENWWHDYTPRLPEKYLTGLSWIPLCQTGFYIVLISYEQLGEREAYAFHRTASRFSFFVLLLSSCLSQRLTSLSPRCVFWTQRCIIINFSLFFPSRTEESNHWPWPNQSICHGNCTERVQLITGGLWLKPRSWEKRSNIQLSTTDYQHQGILERVRDDFKSLRGHRGDVSASLMPMRNALRPGDIDLLWARPMGGAVEVRVTRRSGWRRTEWGILIRRWENRRSCLRAELERSQGERAGRRQMSAIGAPSCLWVIIKGQHITSARG